MLEAIISVFITPTPRLRARARTAAAPTVAAAGPACSLLALLPAQCATARPLPQPLSSCIAQRVLTRGAGEAGEAGEADEAGEAGEAEEAGQAC